MLAVSSRRLPPVIPRPDWLFVQSPTARCESEIRPGLGWARTLGGVVSPTVTMWNSRHLGGGGLAGYSADVIRTTPPMICHRICAKWLSYCRPGPLCDALRCRILICLIISGTANCITWRGTRPTQDWEDCSVGRVA